MINQVKLSLLVQYHQYLWLTAVNSAGRNDCFYYLCVLICVRQQIWDFNLGQLRGHEEVEDEYGGGEMVYTVPKEASSLSKRRGLDLSEDIIPFNVSLDFSSLKLLQSGKHGCLFDVIT